jgi:hypothetical protein
MGTVTAPSAAGMVAPTSLLASGAAPAAAESFGSRLFQSAKQGLQDRFSSSSLSDPAGMARQTKINASERMALSGRTEPTFGDRVSGWGRAQAQGALGFDPMQVQGGKLTMKPVGEMAGEYASQKVYDLASGAGNGESQPIPPLPEPTATPFARIPFTLPIPGRYDVRAPVSRYFSHY